MNLGRPQIRLYSYIDISHSIYSYTLCGCCIALLLLRLLKILSSLVGAEFGYSADIAPRGNSKLLI